MPSRSKGPRLWLRKRRGRTAQWVIRDGSYQKGTGCTAHDIVGAERALAKYLARKHLRGVRTHSRDPDQIPIADVLTIYLTDVVPHHSRPKETKGRIKALDAFFGDKMLSYVTGETCRAYATQRSTDAAARRELEDLRAAINHHRREGLCNKVVEVVLPPERPPRERWLTRSEAARLIWSAWSYREMQKGRQTYRRSRQHVARFILVALYTGTRASAVCGAALNPAAGYGWIDLIAESFTGGQRAAVRQRSDSRRSRCRISSLHICGAGSDRASALPLNGMDARCRASIRRSPTWLPMQVSAVTSHRTFSVTLQRRGSCRPGPICGRPQATSA
jgi:hypothetical protein